MEQKKGKLSIHSENLFPIIKKWLYSEQDIFVRELISNASDAITKMKRLVSMGEAKADDEVYEINVRYDKDKKIIHFEDNGLGMSESEIEEYINKIAFSGAEDFVKKFKDKGENEQIIGHFGLGFYSAFMVASKVTIDSLSYAEGAKAAFWSCDGADEFEMSEGKRTSRGTTVSLHLSEEGEDFKNEYKIKNTLGKYCNFMPYPIYFDAYDEASLNDEKHEDKDGAKVEKERNPINQSKPLYLESPSKASDDDYKEFYRDTFVDFKEPLFWIHLNMEYPFRLKGILYFPKLANDFSDIEGQIKLYNSQVYVADNIKEVIPEFLMVLKGVIDCPDLPLNVSRSFLQNDGFAAKISDYISKKVADKLLGMYKTDREKYNDYWDDINVFIKFGVLKDHKFYENVKAALIYKNIDGEYKNLEDLGVEQSAKESSKDDKSSKTTTILYSDNPELQASYISLLKENGRDIVVMSERIDSAFIGFIEGENQGLKFKRVDSDLSDFLDEKDSVASSKDAAENANQEQRSEEDESISKEFADAIGIESLDVELRQLKSKDTASLIMLSEESRRLADMMKLYSAAGDTNSLPIGEKLVLNRQNPLVDYVLSADKEDENRKLVMQELYDLAQISNKQLSGEKMQNFVARTQKIMLDMLGKNE